MSETKHTSDCPTLTFDYKCSKPHVLSDGAHHWWSGWPGAFCLGCFVEDPNEICVSCCCQDYGEENE